MSAAQVAAALLETRHGLGFEGVGWRRLERALQAAAAAAGRSPDVHAARLAAEPAAVADLLDRATLPETRWFRDPPVFAALVEHAARCGRRGPLVIWSTGCAHGQEPWSLAMALLEAGVADFEVVATDVSPAAVAAAAAGVYAERQLRGLSPGRRGRWLAPAGEGLWRVDDELRAHVRVLRHSLVGDPLPVADAGCALVLCRNVLIYLTPAAQMDALARLRGALAPDGLLALGGGEVLVQRLEGLRPVPAGGAVAYARAARPPAPDPPAHGPSAAGGPSAARLRAARLRAVAAAPAVVPAVTPSPPPGPPAAVQADPDDDPFAGRMAEGEDAAARGDHAGAAAAFRHAAALDPGAPLAHASLALALEALGDPGAPRAFRAALQALGRMPPDAPAGELGGLHVEELARMLADRVAGAAT